MLTAGVAVDKATLNFDKPFSYLVPTAFQQDIQSGSMVLVPFGKGGKLRMGVVLWLKDEEEVKGLKSIVDVKTEQSIVTPFALKLIEYMKESTFCTYYEAVRCVIPYGGLYKIIDGQLQVKHQLPTENQYTAIGCESSVKLTAKQQQVYEYLMDSHKSIKQICNDCKVSKGVVDALIQKGLLETRQVEKQSQLSYGAKDVKEIQLSSIQQQVYEEIIQEDNTKPHLLHGVTSSGKSAVFIQLIKHQLAQGKSAMLLVPEIALTPQMIALLNAHLGDVVSVIHSRLTSAQKLTQYHNIQSKKAKVVVGTRSALFATPEDLGLIIIDEEHEKTFKSESSPRYSAIRVASFIAKEKGCKLLLASATPSVESYYLAKNGFYHLHQLNKRYNDMPMPQVEIIDMRMQALTGDVGVLSSAIIKYLSDNIAEEKQSIILINRRGYATVGVCKSCKQTLQCTDCSVNLVKHKKEQKLSCHYCGKSYPVIDRCPVCQGEVQYIGYGTQKVEEYIGQFLPHARILRMDADTTGQNQSHALMLQDFADKKYDILVGTQMVAKGLDFKDVNLVCVLGIDGALNQVSYNGNEQAFNLLTQVIGRAGRWTKEAKAVIQTYDSQNHIIELAQKGDYECFYQNEIAFRKMNIYPPFCTMCQVAFTSEKEVQAAKDAAAFLKIIQQLSPSLEGLPLVALGPVPFAISMVNKTYRYRLTLKCKNTKKFRSFLQNAIDVYLKDPQHRSAIYVNINPIQE